MTPITSLTPDAGLCSIEGRAADGTVHDITDALQAARFRLGAVGRAGATREPFQVEDLGVSDVLSGPLRGHLPAEGMCSVLAVQLLREDHILGGLMMGRRVPETFPPAVPGLLQTFAT